MFAPLCSMRGGDKTTSHLHMFFKIKLTHYCFKSSPSICISWIHRVFFIFWLSKIQVSPTDIVSSLFPLQCYLSFGRCSHATAPCHASLSWSQDELTVPSSSFDNISSRRLPSNWTQSIESTLPPSANLLRPSDSHPSHSHHHSTVSPFYLLLIQNTMPSEFHPSSPFLFTTVQHPSFLHIMTLTVMN
jgi:hypothetical protein